MEFASLSDRNNNISPFTEIKGGLLVTPLFPFMLFAKYYFGPFVLGNKLWIMILDQNMGKRGGMLQQGAIENGEAEKNEALG